MLNNVSFDIELLNQVFAEYLNGESFSIPLENNPQLGVYVNVPLTFNLWIKDDCIINQYPDLFPPISTHEKITDCISDPKYTFFGSYGVADNIDQILQKYDPYIKDPDNYFCIYTTKITKSEEPQEGGWRWEKWGEYIGTQEPKRQYLYDEPLIESIFVFHIIQVKSLIEKTNE
jgi:hypothetical protein